MGTGAFRIGLRQQGRSYKVEPSTESTWHGEPSQCCRIGDHTEPTDAYPIGRQSKQKSSRRWRPEFDLTPPRCDANSARQCTSKPATTAIILGVLRRQPHRHLEPRYNVIEPLRPFDFDSEQTLTCIPDGTTSAFNVMVNRQTTTVMPHDLRESAVDTDPQDVLLDRGVGSMEVNNHPPQGYPMNPRLTHLVSQSNGVDTPSFADQPNIHRTRAARIACTSRRATVACTRPRVRKGLQGAIHSLPDIAISRIEPTSHAAAMPRPPEHLIWRG